MRRLFFIVRCALFAGMFFARQKASAQRLPFFNLGIEHGLVQSQATCFAQDALGRLWVGTLGGLSCYDGVAFTNFSARDGLPSGTIISLAAAADTSVWVGTSRGLARFKHGKFERTNLATAVTRIAVSADSSVWCLSDGKLFGVRGKIARQIDVGKGRVTAIGSVNADQLFVVVPNNAMFILSGEKVTGTIPLFNATTGAPIVPTRIYQSRKHGVVVLSRQGVFYIAGGKFFPLSDGGGALREVVATCAAETPDGTLWLGTGSGVLRVRDSTVQLIRRRQGLSDNLFYDALADAEGNLWFASDGQGLFRFSGAPFEMLDESSGLPAAQVMAIAADGDRTLFLGTYDAGLFSFRAGVVKRINFPGGVVPSVTALASSRDGRLYIGTRALGLWRMDGRGRILPLLMQDGTTLSALIAAIYAHPFSGEIWVGTATGAGVVQAGVFRPLPDVSITVQDFAALSADTLLMATSGGLRAVVGGRAMPFRTGTAVDSVVPQCLLSRGEELWIGTPDHGLLRYHRRTRRVAIIDRKAGLRSDFVYNLALDRGGAVWAGTGNGIHRISGGTQATSRVEYFGEAYGVRGMESNQRASLLMPDGSLWFGTTTGAVHYRSSATRGGGLRRRAPVSLSIIGVGARGLDTVPRAWYAGRVGAYGIPAGLRLPYRENSLSVRFRAVSLGGPEEELYRYRMDGGEQDWSAWSGEERVTFSALAPGIHALDVECSVDGKNVARNATFRFAVETPFHKTPLFYFLIGAGCIGIGVGVQSLAARRRRAREAALDAARRDEQAKVRQRTAEDFHDEVGNTITRMTVLTSVLQSKVKEPDAVRIIEQIRENAGRLYSGTRDILWSLKPGADNLWEILHRIRDFGLDLFGDTEVRFVFGSADERWRAHRLSLDWSRNLTMIFKEGMNNALKYSGAGRVEFSATLVENDVLVLRLADDGRGFDAAEIRAGHGLQNMRTRAGRLGGTMEVVSVVGGGVVLVVRFKIPRSEG